MNYNPYYFTPYMNSGLVNHGLVGNLLKGGKVNFSTILNGTQKALNIANQAIPVIRQISPVMKNAKTMFHVMNEFKKVETPISPLENIDKKEEKKEEVKPNFEEPVFEDGPTFFI